MKTGIELIAEERQEQIVKHGYSMERDAKLYSHETGNNSPITYLADLLLKKSITEFGKKFNPFKWDAVIWDKMVNKPYKERLIIAGALIAAEIDRLNTIEKHS